MPVDEKPAKPVERLQSTISQISLIDKSSKRVFDSWTEFARVTGYYPVEFANRSLCSANRSAR